MNGRAAGEVVPYEEIEIARLLGGMLAEADAVVLEPSPRHDAAVWRHVRSQLAVKLRLVSRRDGAAHRNAEDARPLRASTKDKLMEAVAVQIPRGERSPVGEHVRAMPGAIHDGQRCQQLRHQGARGEAGSIRKAVTVVRLF
jgi:hypothetical protein